MYCLALNTFIQLASCIETLNQQTFSLIKTALLKFVTLDLLDALQE